MVHKVVNAGFDTLESIKDCSTLEISNVDGFAEISAELLKNGIDKLYLEMMAVLNSNKIKIRGNKMSKKLEGLTFCFTGKLETMKRAEAEQMVSENGGTSKKGVVKNLSYLVTNDTTPTVKYNKAKEQGTKIITENEFLDLIK